MDGRASFVSPEHTLIQYAWAQRETREQKERAEYGAAQLAVHRDEKCALSCSAILHKSVKNQQEEMRTT
jgi:hypothetical protein